MDPMLVRRVQINSCKITLLIKVISLSTPWDCWSILTILSVVKLMRLLHCWGLMYSGGSWDTLKPLPFKSSFFSKAVLLSTSNIKMSNNHTRKTFLKASKFKITAHFIILCYFFVHWGVISTYLQNGAFHFKKEKGQSTSYWTIKIMTSVKFVWLDQFYFSHSKIIYHTKFMSSSSS